MYSLIIVHVLREGVLSEYSIESLVLQSKNWHRCANAVVIVTV